MYLGSALRRLVDTDNITGQKREGFLFTLEEPIIVITGRD